MDLARLTRVSFFQGMPQWALVRLAEAATEEQRPAGGMVLHQSDRAWAVHFLVTGSVQILLRVGDEDLLVAVLRRPGELLGWSAFRAPYRYTTSVRCEEPSRLVRIPAAAFEELFERDPALATTSSSAWPSAWPTGWRRTSVARAGERGPGGRRHTVSASVHELLERSPFLEGLDRRDLAELAGRARMVAAGPGERVFVEGEPATSLFLLVSGAVEPSFGGPAGGEGVAMQTVTHQGHPTGWSAMVAPVGTD